MKRRRILAAVLTAGAALTVLAQTVPGYSLTYYAAVTGPVELTFAPDGTLFCGTDLTFSGGTATSPAYIHRVGVGGTPVTEYGASMIPDPDAVLYDTFGMVSGVPGSVLVAGETAGGGQLLAIWPDQQVVLVFAPVADVGNPNHMAFDSAGRAIIASASGSVWACSGGLPSLLFMDPSAVGGMDVAPPGDLIYAASVDGVIRVYDTAGSLVNGSFATGIGVGAPAALAFGPGGGLWGNDLYAVDRQLGTLLRIDSLGQPTVLGTGFGGPGNLAGDLEFGPDGALYVSMLAENRVIRIIPEPCALMLATLGLLVIRRR